MFKLAKAAVLVGMLSTLTACTGHVPFRRSSVAAARPHSSKRFSGVKKPGMSRFFVWLSAFFVGKRSCLPDKTGLRFTHKPNRLVHRF